MPELHRLPAVRWLAEAEAGSLLLTATGHLQRHLHESYARHKAEQGRVVWEAPSILTWHAWLERMWQERLMAGVGDSEPAVLLHPAQSAALWRQVLAADGATRSLLHADGLARQAETAWRLLHAWDLGTAVAAAREVRPEAARFAAWARSYREHTKRRGWFDGARLPGSVARWVEEGALPAPGRIVLAGFDTFDPAQVRLLDALLRRGTACAELEAPSSGASGEDGTLQRVAFTDAEAEAEAAARWARSQLDLGAATVGIVVQGLEARAGQLERIFRDLLAPDSVLPGADDQSLPYRLSLGPPLAEVPLVRGAFRLLGLGGHKLDLEPLEAALLLPYLGGAAAERERRGLLVTRLRKLGDPALTLDGVIRHATQACPELTRHLNAAKHLLARLPGRQSHAAWAQSFTDLLRALGWPGHGEGGRTLSSAEFLAYERWRDLLDELCGLDLVLPHVDRGEALARLRELAAASSFLPPADAAPVQILGHLDAAGLSFDRLWVLGMDNADWPRPPQPHPLLPIALQRARGLPRASAERELRFAERVTARLQGAAPRIVMSYAEQQGAARLRPSPLIAALPAGSPMDLGLPDQPSLAQGVRQHLSATTCSEPRGEELLRPLPPGTALRSGTGIFEDMAACPFRAQARHRLGADDAPLPEPGLSPADHGSLLHAVLHRVWAKLGNQASLRSQSDAALSTLLKEAIQRALNEFRSGHERLSAALANLEAERLERLALALLDLERTQRPPFAVTASEQALEATVGGVQVRLRMDRVDTLADGSRLLLDYKSGQASPAQWLSERPEAPQLPLYAVAHPALPVAIAFVRVRSERVRYAGVSAQDIGIPGVLACADWKAGRETAMDAAPARDRSREDDTAETQGTSPHATGVLSWDALLAHWRRVLASLGADFRAGEAAVDPQRTACRYCPLPGLCRIDELGSLARADESAADSLATDRGGAEQEGGDED